MPVPVKHHKVLFLRGLIIRALGIHTTGENVQNYNGIFEPNSTGDQLLYTFKTEIFICKTIYLITIPMVAVTFYTLDFYARTFPRVN